MAHCRRLSVPVLCAAFVAVFAISAPAHEIGTTRVTVAFPEGSAYAIEVVTDASSLVEKLESVGGSTAPAAMDAPRLQAALRNFDDRFRRRVKIAFGSTAARPQIEYIVASPKEAGLAALATIHMTGEIPPDARQFTWSFGWTFVTYALTVHGAGNPTTEWLEGSQASTPFTLSAPQAGPGRLQTAWRYLTLGFTHILPNGVDHMLFVLGIYLLSGRARNVLWQVSAFTIAHSITLGLSLYGAIAVAPRIVEPMIAISIAYVAVENIFLSELKAWRVGLVFLFGLLHGMGFAGALQELGLPRSEFLTALVTFNIGVEAGQLAVIGVAFLLLGRHFAGRAWYRARIVIPISAMIACTALVWTVQRLRP